MRVIKYRFHSFHSNQTHPLHHLKDLTTLNLLVAFLIAGEGSSTDSDAAAGVEGFGDRTSSSSCKNERDIVS